MLLLARPTPHLVALFAALAFYLILLNDIRHLGACDPGSYFFKPDLAFQRDYSLQRETEALDFIATTNTRKEVKSATGHNICVGIATVQRDGARYFQRAVGSLLDGLTDAERNDLYLVNFIVNLDPAEHQAFGEDWLDTVSDEILTYRNATQEVKDGLHRALASETWYKEKPLLDYTYLLQRCYDEGSPYILMIEDDAIAADGWYLLTTYALAKLQRQTQKDATLYLRLFYNERLLGWNNEEWLSYAVWSICMEFLLVGVVFAIVKYVPVTRSFLTTGTIATICLLFGPLSLALYFLAGRLTVSPLPHGLQRMDKYGCCSQAFIFQRQRIPELIAYYRQEGRGYVDVLTEEYAEKNKLARWALVPSVFQHVGSTSSKSVSPSKWNRNNAENIWNFAFEKFKGKALRTLHLPP